MADVALRLAAALLLGGALGVSGAAGAACPSPNPNASAPPFVDGCPLPAAALNRLAVATISDPSTWGAVGNGIANDSAAVQACFNTGACSLPPGKTYAVDDIALPSPLTVLGASPASSKLLRLPNSAASGGVLHCYNAAASGCSHVWLEGFTIDGNKANEEVGSIALNIGYYSDVHIKNLVVINSKGAGVSLINSVDEAANTTSSTDSLTVSGNSGDGLQVLLAAWRLTLHNTIATYNGAYGTNITYSESAVTPVDNTQQYITVDGGEFSNNGASGFVARGWLQGWAGTTPIWGPGIEAVNNMKVTGVTARNNWRYGIAVQGRNTLVADSIAGNNNLANDYGGGFLGPCENCTWDNLISEGPGFVGLDIGTSLGAHVRGGTFRGHQVGVNIGASSFSDVRGATITNNSEAQITAIAAEGSGDNYGIQGWTSSLVIEANRIGCEPASGIYGIRQWNGGDDVHIVDNYVQGCAADKAISVDAHTARVERNLVTAGTGAGGRGTVDYAIDTVSGALTIPIWVDSVGLLGINSFSTIQTIEQAAVGTGISGVQVTNGGSGYTNGTTSATFTGCTTAPTTQAYVNPGGVLTGVRITAPGSGCTAPTVSFSGGTGATAAVYGTPLSGGFRKDLTLLVGGAPAGATLTIPSGGNLTLAAPLSAAAASSNIKLYWGANPPYSVLFETSRVIH